MGLADITPSGVRKAYRDRNWTPCRFRYGNGESGEGDIIGVLMGFPTWRDRVLVTNEMVQEWLGITFDEHEGLMRGFDGRPEHESYRVRDRQRKAYDLGAACWLTVRDLCPCLLKEVAA